MPPEINDLNNLQGLTKEIYSSSKPSTPRKKRKFSYFSKKLVIK